MPHPSNKHSHHPTLLAIGGAIKAARETHGITQDELGELAKIDGKYVGWIERGTQNVGVMRLDSIAHALNMTLADLIGAARM